MWRSFFETRWTDCSLRDSVDVTALEKHRDELSIPIPKPLLGLYRESNGVLGPDGDYLVLPIEELVETNVDMWLNQEYENQFIPFESLFFFAYDQNDNMYAFAIRGDTADQQQIFKWRRDNDSRLYYADGLEQYMYKRWKCFSENNHLFWEPEINCKDFDDYRLFLRWLSQPEQKLEGEIALEGEFSP